MNLFEYKYKGKNYEFRLTNKAKCEIERIMKEKASKTFGDPDVLTAYNSLELLKDKKLKNDEKQALIEVIAPKCGKLFSMDDTEIDPVDLMYILLRTHPNYKDVTLDQWDEIEFAMELEYGYEELMDKFQEVYDKVFTVLDKMNESKKMKPNVHGMN